MDRLITELLSYGKRMTIHPVPVALEPLLKDLMEHFIATGASPKIRWSFSVADALPLIELDPVLIRQAFSNLIQNALEAMPDGGEIKMSVSVRPEGWIEVKIYDTGSGIAKEHLDKIFLPFYTTKEKGTGLGLALVHKIILAHNGHVTVKCAEGGGTCFIAHFSLESHAVHPKEQEWKQF